MVQATSTYQVMDSECTQTVTSWDSIEAAKKDAENRVRAGESVAIAKVTITPLMKAEPPQGVDWDVIQPEPALTAESYN